ncbi:hypothetical protein ACTWQB_05725 [Piscibacillus sp. B03]|uniref:hypothetical protein n=1 Tax=Piscibacillus sp. B03 TaxID=3457430 RepID=UPI003FCC8CCF
MSSFKNSLLILLVILVVLTIIFLIYLYSPKSIFSESDNSYSNINVIEQHVNGLKQINAIATDEALEMTNNYLEHVIQVVEEEWINQDHSDYDYIFNEVNKTRNIFQGLVVTVHYGSDEGIYFEEGINRLKLLEEYIEDIRQ